jgi:hypothetical protein
MSNKRALVVGISDYPDSTPKLSASVGEARLWATLLRDNGFKVMQPLLNANATRDKVIGGLKSLLKRAGDGDKLIFVYCGHGTIIDVEGAGELHTEEALYLFREPSSVAKGATLTDTDIANIVKAAELPTSATFAIVADCCHAGGLSVVPAGAQAQFVDLLTDAEKKRFPPAVVFGTLASLGKSETVGRPIVVAACHRDQNAIQEPPVGHTYRLLFSHRALDELNKNVADTYAELVSNVKPLAQYTNQEPEIVGNTLKAGEHFLSEQLSSFEISSAGKESVMRTITVRIAGTCCFVDAKDQASFKKRLILPFDNLSAKPSERHIPYVEFPDANILECDGGDLSPDQLLGPAYPHQARLADGSLFPLPLLYRRFELSEHVVDISKVDSTASDLTVFSSFDTHVPKMKNVFSKLTYHPRDECFQDEPYLPLAAAFFDISKGILKAGTLYDFVTRFVTKTEITAKYQTPEFVELLLPITTPEVTLTFTKGNVIHTVLLDANTDNITIGNQPESDITGAGSGDDLQHHFNLYYNLAVDPRPDDPALPEKDLDPVASCTATNWP